MISSQRLVLGIELFEDRLLPSTLGFRDPTPSEPASSTPAVTRPPDGGPISDPGGRGSDAPTGAIALDRGARPSDYSIGNGGGAAPGGGGAGVPRTDLAARPPDMASGGAVAPTPGSRPPVDILRTGPPSAAALAGLAEAIGAGLRGRAEATGQVAFLLPAGTGQHLFVKFAQPGEGGPFVGADAVVQAGVPPVVVVTSASVAGAASLQVISMPAGVPTSVGPLFSSGAADVADASDPVPPTRTEQIRPADPTPPGGDAGPVDADLPGGVPVAGLLRLDCARLEAGARHLVSCVSDLGLELPEEINVPVEFGWLTTAVVLSGGAGYALWVNRSALRPGRRLADSPGFGPRAVGEGYDRPVR
ncbi:MAG: hypothetical protein JWO38_6000 [Gemmataceae bacterium]|nr:hypothetical protein [Gemmataceae bacterium]